MCCVWHKQCYSWWSTGCCLKETVTTWVTCCGCMWRSQYNLGERCTLMSSCFILFCFKETAGSFFTAKGPIPSWRLRPAQVHTRWDDENGALQKREKKRMNGGRSMEYFYMQVGAKGQCFKNNSEKRIPQQENPATVKKGSQHTSSNLKNLFWT